MVFSLCAMIYSVPISIGLVESFFSLALFFFLIKRVILTFAFFSKSSSEHFQSFKQRLQKFLITIKPYSSCLSGPMALFILAGFVSIFVSQYKMLSIKGFMFKLLEWTFTYFIFVEAFKDKRSLKIFMGVFFVSALLATINGIVQLITGREFIWHKAIEFGRIMSSFRHPNDFGGYLVVICLILFNFIFLTKKDHVASQNQNSLIWLQIFCAVFFLLTAACLGWTYSRGAWLAFFLALLFWGIHHPRKFYLSVITIIIFWLIFFPKMKEERNISLLREGTPETHEELEAERMLLNVSSPWGKISEFFLHFSGSGRSTYWEEALSIIRRYPVFGIGINAYSMVAKNYKIIWGGYPHNCYLQLTAEMGLVGLISLLFIIWTLFRYALFNLSKVHDPFLFLTASGSLYGLFGFLVHSFVDTNFYSVQLGNLMWVLMAVVVACIEIDKKLSKDHNQIESV